MGLLKSNIRIRVAGIILNSKKEILLIRQSKEGRNYWLLPGGGIEVGERAITALKRELKEELGLVLKDAKFLLYNESIGPKGKRHIIQLVYSVKIRKGIPVLNTKEKNILEFRYFQLKGIRNLEIRPDLKEYLSKGKFKESSSVESKWIE